MSDSCHHIQRKEVDLKKIVGNKLQKYYTMYSKGLPIVKDDTKEGDVPTKCVGASNAINTNKRKRKKIGSICIENCKFGIVKEIAKNLGMKIVKPMDEWNVYWTDYILPQTNFKDVKRFQRVNHIPGMEEICRKDKLARNLNFMLKKFPDDYNIFPKTWCLPTEYMDVLRYARANKRKTFIIKPESGCRGQGIYLTKNLKDIQYFRKLICQVYIARPLLIDGFKFDLRVYILISSCNPLRIYVYNEGLVRFATSRYKEPNYTNISNVYMHLTNYSVNKHSKTYTTDEGGSKRRISSLNKWFESKLYNVKEIWNSIDEAIVKTILTAYPTLKHSCLALFRGHSYRQASFELLGFDIILNKNLKPYILEVNHSPSLHVDSKIDREIKESLLQDTFKILNLTQCQKRKASFEDKQMVHERLFDWKKLSEKIKSDLSFGEQEREKQTKWEELHLGNFRKVYPTKETQKYEAFIVHAQSFQDRLSCRTKKYDGNHFYDKLAAIKNLCE